MLSAAVPSIPLLRSNMPPRIDRAPSVGSESEEDEREAGSDVGDAADVDPQHQRIVDRCRAAISSTDFSLMKTVSPKFPSMSHH